MRGKGKWSLTTKINLNSKKKLRNKVLCARESSSPIEDFLGEGEESVGVLFTTTKSRFNIGVLTSVVKKPMLT